MDILKTSPHDLSFVPIETLSFRFPESVS